MKKLLRIFTLALAALAAIGASAENPEALYLVGSMNGWLTPDTGGTQYRLTDPDGDGTYTGTFEIPASESLEFKVFDGLYGWGDTRHYYGLHSYGPFGDKIYSDVTTKTTGYNNPSLPNISFANWLGGKLEVSINLYNTYYASISLKGSGQQAFGTIPDKVWVIGSFNDFKLPTPDNDNGAIAIEKVSDDLVYSHQGSVNLPAGDVEMRIYVPAMGSHSETSFGATDCEVGGLANPMVQTMFRSPEYTGFGVEYSGLELSQESFLLRDWNGGDINHFYIQFFADTSDFKTLFSITSKNGPVLADRPEKIYAIIKDGDSQPELQELEWNVEGCVTLASIQLPVNLSRESYSILLTSEASLTPNPANCFGAWGCPSATIQLTPEQSSIYTTLYMPFQRGSATPIVVNTENANGRMSLAANLLTSTLQIYPELNYVNDNPEDLYLIGSLKGDPQNGGWDITDSSMKLDYKGEGIFTGAFPVANPEDVEFRFYTALGDWNSNSIGSGYDDYMPEVINLPYQGACVDGKGNWKVNGFTGETLYVQVDLKNMKVLFDDEPLGGIADAVAEAGLSVDGLTVSSADGSAIEMYDLYGRRIASGPAVQAPARGLYIVRGARGAAKLRF